MGGGLALYLVGVSILAAAQPHLFDAVNVYNDDVRARGEQTAPGAPAPAAAPAGTTAAPVQIS